jgi:hypothetical protein
MPANSLNAIFRQLALLMGRSDTYPPGGSSFRVLISASWYQSMTTHTRYRFIGVAMVFAHLLIALFAILLAALLLFLVTYMG